MVTKKTELGTIEISQHALANLVSRIAKQTYGVADVTAPDRASQLAATLKRKPVQGVDIQILQDALIVDLHLVVYYGINIASISNSLIRAVRYHLSQQTQMDVQQINVHIVGLKISSPDQTF